MALKSLSALAIVAVLSLVTAAVRARAQEASVPSLDQAVILVHQQTGGRILSADQRHVGRRLEYRVKVLTPDGHVRVVTLSSDAGHPASRAPSTENPVGRAAGNKEKH
ncbi:hypothetical protein [Dyella sp. A6]|uniref:PepSY domain-containing protein n=1 Tax=Dyella aluminiiresistens TaxID=3069105 RepID=UPI002E79F8B4|nr:hypothetical protein [Dyella sp. A6]